MRHKPKAVRRRDDDHEPVPVGAEGNVGHDLAPIRLHRIEVGNPNAEQGPAQPVVDGGHERLLVLPLLGAGHDVGPTLQNGPHQRRDVLGQILEIRGIEDENVASRGLTSRAQGVGDPALASVGDHTKEGVRRAELAEHTRRLVA